MKACLLTVAGHDPSVIAGILLDIRVLKTFGFHALAAATAVIVQNTVGVRSVCRLEAGLVSDQDGAQRDDVRFAGLKIVMLGG